MLQGKMNVTFPGKAETGAKKAPEATVDNQNFPMEIFKKTLLMFWLEL